MAAIAYVLDGVICHRICRRQETSSKINTVSPTTSYTPAVCAVLGVTGLINDEAPKYCNNNQGVICP